MYGLQIRKGKEVKDAGRVKSTDHGTDSWIQWERRRAITERKFRPRVYSVLQNIVKGFTEDIRTNGINHAKNKIDFYLNYTPLYKVLLRLYLESGTREARATIAQLRRQKGLGNSKDYIEAIRTYFRLHLLNKSVIPITQTTKEKVLEIIERGVTEGWGADKTALEITRFCDEWNRSRSLMIVRTETVRSANFTKLETAKRNKFETTKVWITARDERVRGNPLGRFPANKPGKPNHWKLHGRELRLTGDFENGCEFPGDPKAIPSETINCRCTLIFRTKKDSQGNPIPKRNPTPSILENVAAFLTGFTLGQLIDQIVNE